MKTIQLGKNVIEIFDDIKEFPITRYKDFQKYLVEDSGIGSNMGAVNKHFEMLDRFLKAGKLSEAQQERDNLHMNLFMMIEGISITSVSFCCLIHSINGDVVKDLTEEGLKAMGEKLADHGMTSGQLDDLLEDVKKKLILS